MRKGQGILFNWIFISIVGILFLVLLVSFAFQYKKIEEEKNNFKIATSIDTSLSGLNSENLYTSLSYDKKIQFDSDCDNFLVNSYKVPLNDKILFAEEFKDNNVKVWVKELKFPYSVGNLYFLAGNKKYYLVGENSLEMPEIFDVEEISLSNIGNQKGKFVFFIDPGDVKDRLNDYIIVKEDSVVFPDGSELPYFNELVYGAIFSDKKLYECNFERVMEKIKAVNQIYLKKASLLSLWTGCNYDLTYFRIVNELIENKEHESLIENQKSLEFQNEAFCREVF